jgi:hypothetical protein
MVLWFYGFMVLWFYGLTVARLAPGQEPHPLRTFDIDLTPRAGQFIMLELACLGTASGSSMARWSDPRIVVE